LGGQQEDHNFKDSFGYIVIVRPCLKQNKAKKETKQASKQTAATKDLVVG
jgi:hypothetical protein